MTTSAARTGSLALAAVLLASAAAPALAADGPLVTTDWLEAQLDADDVRVFEVSVNPEVYEGGHVPGAVNLLWHTDLVDPVRRDIAGREALEARLRAAGLDEGDTIVLYGDTNNWFAAWGAWVLHVYGLDAKLLDGGRKLWEAEGRPLSSTPPSREPGDVTLAAADQSARARLADVVAASESGSHHIVDIRSHAEYSGEIIAPPGLQETAIRAGHVTGAINIPWGAAVQEDGRFKPASELEALYAAEGVDGSKPVITYCRIGERSSHTWFALSKILSYDVRNYDGSWTEYGNAVDVPITNLAGTVWTGR